MASKKNNKKAAKPAKKAAPKNAAKPSKSAPKKASKPVKATPKKAAKPVKKTTKPAPKKAAKPVKAAPKKAAKPVKKATKPAPKKVTKPVKVAPKKAAKAPVKKAIKPVKAAPKKVVKPIAKKSVKPVAKAVVKPAKPVKEPKVKEVKVKSAPVEEKKTKAVEPVAQPKQQRPGNNKKPASKPQESMLRKVVDVKNLPKPPVPVGKPATMILNNSTKPLDHTKAGKVDERTRYNDEELKEFKAIILGKLAEARKDLDLLRSSLTHTGDNGTDDTSPTFKMMEDGSETLSREESAQLAGRQEKFIQALEAALVRIENKTYGVCRVTGRLINKERLKLVPHTTLSIEAKNLQN